jgi:F0F1-type ATP synthase assembly protein I
VDSAKSPSASRNLPRPLKIPTITTLTTVSNMREFLKRPLPAERRERNAWRHSTDRLYHAARGRSILRGNHTAGERAPRLPQQHEKLRDMPMMTVMQTTRLLSWVIAGLVVFGILLYFFGPTALRTDEIIIIGLLIIGLIWFQVWLRRRGV